MYVYTYTYIYIYVYVYVYVYVCVYVYAYVYVFANVCVHAYVYVYVYFWRKRRCEGVAGFYLISLTRMTKLHGVDMQKQRASFQPGDVNGQTTCNFLAGPSSTQASLCYVHF